MAEAGRTAEDTRQHLIRLEWELAQLRLQLAAEPMTPAQRAAVLLERRPDVARVIGSRPGVIAMALLQHGIWAVRHRLQRMRVLGTRISPPLPAALPPAALPLPETQAAEAASPEPLTPARTVAAPPLLPAVVIPETPRLADIGFDPTILQRRPRILIDVTPTARLPPFTGGIARVARSFAAAGVRTGLALPVHIVDGELRSYYRHALLEAPITPGLDDVYVVLDVFWNAMDDYHPLVTRVKAAGARIAVIVHDIGLIRFPALFREDMPPAFRSGLLTMLQHADVCLGVSRHVEDDLRAWLAGIGFPRMPSLSFGHVLLGVTKSPIGTAGLRRTITEAFDGGNTFLSVGTMEPRKGYSITLDACELAWASGASFALVLLGRYGWSSEALQARVQTHPEFARRLFWFQDATDAELAYAYTHCRSLIQSSLDEGFCLPVSEACLFGAAVIASDLPVIRELAGSGISYYPTGSPEQLTRCINEALVQQPAAASFVIRSWTESMQALAAALGDPAGALPAPAYHDPATRPIHVACCLDDAFAMPAGVLAASVAAATRDAPVMFHMLHPDGLETDLKALREALDAPNFRVVPHVVHGETSELYTNRQYSQAVYYRFMIPDLIDADRVIYLDSDTMVRRSLSALWTLDLQGHPVAACVDFLRLSTLNGDRIPLAHADTVLTVPEYCKQVLGIDLATTPYFNSGVMVMNLEAWRRTDLAGRCRAECGSDRVLNFVDQDATNQIVRGNFLRLDARWNALVYLEQAYRPASDANGTVMGGYEPNLLPPSGELAQAMRDWARDPWIVHFAHCSKPWRAEDRRTAFDDEFWQHAFHTPFGALLHLRFLKQQEAARAHLEWVRCQGVSDR